MGDACTRQNRISWIVAYAEALRCLPRRVSLKQQELRFPALALWQQDLYRSPSLCCRCSYSPGGLRRPWPVRALEALRSKPLRVADSSSFAPCGAPKDCGFQHISPRSNIAALGPAILHKLKLLYSVPQRSATILALVCTFAPKPFPAPSRLQLN